MFTIKDVSTSVLRKALEYLVEKGISKTQFFKWDGWEIGMPGQTLDATIFEIRWELGRRDTTEYSPTKEVKPKQEPVMAETAKCPAAGPLYDIGDVVTLPSGGPVLTVKIVSVGLSSIYYSCLYFNDVTGKFEEINLPEEALEYVP